MGKWILLLLLGATSLFMAVFELQTSYFQAKYFSNMAGEFSFTLEKGPADTSIYPQHGPYNVQQGYTRLQHFSARLQQRGLVISRQAQPSPQLAHYVSLGGTPPYREKPQTGLTIVDEQGALLYSIRLPGNVYQRFEDIPPLLTNALLFIENRELLSDDFPRRNPAVEWDRLAEAVLSRAVNMLLPETSVPGGSTLATQLEKYRYSPGGVTTDAREKLRQMISASVRAYQDGPQTTEARRRIVRDYLNSTPLSGRYGFGEIQGIGDGLWAWYDIDFARANQLLSLPKEDDAVAEKARVFKAALSLLLSQRRPSYYLLGGRQELEQLTDTYLRLMTKAGVITPALRDAALAQPLKFRDGAPWRPVPAFVGKKAVNSVRTSLLPLLGVDSLYTLDRLDLAVTTTIIPGVQEAVSDQLQRISQPQFAREAGLVGPRLLREDQLAAVGYSFLLYENTPKGNLLRVQTDNLNMPFDMNADSKLDLGSTAKLRTLVSYLEVIETVYNRHARKTVAELAEAAQEVSDPLSQWALAYLHQFPDATLAEILDAAMTRQYSASPAERFYTAGGLHRFSNFERNDNSRVMTVAEALNRSVNLVFIRVMRDIARFYTMEIPGAESILSNPQDPRRQIYLSRFADMEGRVYLGKFYKEYKGLDDSGIIRKLGERTKPVPSRLAMAFRAVKPQASEAQLQEFLIARLGDKAPDTSKTEKLYQQYDPGRFNSADRAYLAKLNPLELWLVKHRLENPAATFADMVNASAEERQTAYAWLFKTGRVKTQNNKIRILLEQEAFAAIHRQWQRLGYPFSSLVPSYATALGASADRPIALAELMGILVNNGVRLPLHQMDSLLFAQGTPYETLFRYRQRQPEQLLSPELCQTVRRGLMGVVDSGTARRLKSVFVDADGKPLAIGGKTGTADHRKKHYAAGGRLIGEEVVNRNAIFTFFIGERYFGVILAHVGGEQAKNFEFTSGLAAQLLKAMQPALQPLFDVGADAVGDVASRAP